MRQRPDSFRVGKYHAEFVAVRIIRRPYGASGPIDGNWLEAEIEVDAGELRTLYKAYLRAEELRGFRDQLARLHASESDAAEFETMEGQLGIRVSGDGAGRFSAACVAVDDPGFGDPLSFTLEFGRTELGQTLDALNHVVTEFPVVGELKRR